MTEVQTKKKQGIYEYGFLINGMRSSCYFLKNKLQRVQHAAGSVSFCDIGSERKDDFAGKVTQNTDKMLR